MKLWQKKTKLDQTIEKFSVGNDYLLDKRLVKYDCQASRAHAKMLFEAGILTGWELKQLTEGLKEIEQLANLGEFHIELQHEDGHTAIEHYLTKKYGNTGAKIHTARSRNDQVLTALRLYEKEELGSINNHLESFKKVTRRLCETSGHIPLPGYTHTRRAMPTNVGTWLGAFLAAAGDDIALCNAVFTLIDQSPLGTAAGYGVPVIDINRELTAAMMGFSRIMENPIHAGHSRGKFEAMILGVCSQIMFDLNKLASDLILFSSREFGFINLKESICTGSSIMPQKKNPDPLELIRASYHQVLGCEITIKSTIANLMSGYHRDLQLIKEPLFKGIDRTKECLTVMSIVLNNLEFNMDVCTKALTQELYATQQAYELVGKGIPFRLAYHQIATKFK